MSPSLLHEALLTLFRNRPTLAPELLVEALQAELPAYSEVRLESAELSQVVPTEYHADLVVLLLDGEPVAGIVVEVQLGRDEDKRYSWPLYAAALRARLRCPVLLLVVCPDQPLAEWCAHPIELGDGRSVFYPLVLARLYRVEATSSRVDAQFCRFLV